MKRVTLHESFAARPGDVGSEADTFDVEAYNEALERAWPSVDDDYDTLTEPVAERLCEMVLEGQLGRDRLGRDWVQVAKTWRNAKG